jgi:hypothetical protein
MLPLPATAGSNTASAGGPIVTGHDGLVLVVARNGKGVQESRVMPGDSLAFLVFLGSVNGRRLHTHTQDQILRGR